MLLLTFCRKTMTQFDLGMWDRVNSAMSGQYELVTLIWLEIVSYTLKDLKLLSMIKVRDFDFFR